MEKKLLVISIVIIISILSIAGCNENTSNSSNNKLPNTVYVDANGDANFSTIQLAINNVSDGDIVFVRKGIYNEVLTLDKSIQLIGENSDETIINYNITNAGILDSTILVTADNCVIKGFTINIGESNKVKKGIKVKSSNNIISDNTITHGDEGISLDKDSKHNNITRNNFLNSTKGIYLYYSEFNDISNNNFSYSSYNGIFASASDNNNIFYNHFSRNDHCIRIKSSNNNRVFGNTFINNGGGLYLCCLSQNNIVYYNNFIQNTNYHATAGDNLLNQWNYENVGNYWDDYTEIYQYATQENGIWQTPYIIHDEKNKDMFPFVDPIDL